MVTTFEGGKIRDLAIPATAGNVVRNITPTSGFRYKILRGKIILACDLTVANRYIDVYITDGTNIVEDMFRSTVAVAGATIAISMGEINALVGAGIAGGGTLYVGILPIIIEYPDQFRIFITNGVAGDSFYGNFTALEQKV